jgi:hypothetical protein
MSKSLTEIAALMSITDCQSLGSLSSNCTSQKEGSLVQLEINREASVLGAAWREDRRGFEEPAKSISPTQLQQTVINP